MPQTLPNGITAPINSDAYNLAGDLATFGNTANVIIPVANQAARDALTPYPGMTVCRLDMRGAPIFTWDGSVWVGAAPIPMASYTSTWGPRNSGFPTPGVYVSLGRITMTGAITNVLAATFANNTVYTMATLPAGTYPTMGQPEFMAPLRIGSTIYAGVVEVTAAGSVNLNLMTGTSGIAANQFTISLEGMSWAA